MTRVKPTVVHEAECETERRDDPLLGHLRWWTLLSADRTPTASLTLGVAEIDPGERDRLRLHRHPPDEVYYVLCGEGVVEIDGQAHPVRAGSAVFVPGGAAHGVRNTGPDPLRLVYVFPTASFDEVEYEHLEGAEDVRE